MSTAISAAITVSFVVLSLAAVCSFVRVIRGPTFADRVLAIDLLALIGAGMMAVAGIAFDSALFLDIAMILVAAGFVGTAAFAQLVEQQALHGRDRDGAA